MHKTSSGFEIEQDGERKPITEVINTYELAGDAVRANLMAAIRAAVLEARETQLQAKRYMQRERQLAAQHG
ncbi:hypothetical protein LCGC14_0921670 [marine sediment metagenome]|uniref:Uncharacterized protein n=1 Tax=marine sediment metagenome TaxID=412755 RepID=A0A0F9NQP0_9ZZZZ